MQKKGSPPTLSVGILIGAAMVENSMEVLQKTKNRTTYDPTIPLLAIYLEQNSSKIQAPLFHSSTIYNSQDMETI